MLKKATYTILTFVILLIIVLIWRYNEIQKFENTKKNNALNASSTVTVLATSTATTSEAIVYETALQYKTDLFKTVNVIYGQKLLKDTKLTGEVRGNWYFEATFPVELRTGTSTVIWSGVATTGSNWMTTNFVPFSVMLNYTPFGTPTPAILVLKKDNPSGEPINNDELLIPVVLQ
jgi:hypothetical protein